MMSEDHEYNESEDDAIVTAAKSSGTADEALMAMLKELRKKEAKKLGVPPFVVFQDPSLEDMALKYPISLEELINIHGVGEGKARKYGKAFVTLIQRYVEDNDIIRPDDLVVKSTGVNSANKLYIIQNILSRNKYKMTYLKFYILQLKTAHTFKTGVTISITSRVT